MADLSGVPIYLRSNGSDVIRTGKPPFLTALTMILELSLLQQQPAYVIVNNMHGRHPAFRIFTSVFVAYLLGTEGPGVPLPHNTPQQMIEYARGIFKVIIHLRDNGCTVSAILDRLKRDGYKPLPPGMVQTIASWYQNYRVF